MAKLVSDGVTLNGRLLLMSLPLLVLPLLAAALWLSSGHGADGEFILTTR